MATEARAAAGEIPTSLSTRSARDQHEIPTSLSTQDGGLAKSSKPKLDSERAVTKLDSERAVIAQTNEAAPTADQGLPLPTVETAKEARAGVKEATADERRVDEPTWSDARSDLERKEREIAELRARLSALEGTSTRPASRAANRPALGDPPTAEAAVGVPAAAALGAEPWRRRSDLGGAGSTSGLAPADESGDKGRDGGGGGERGTVAPTTAKAAPRAAACSDAGCSAVPTKRSRSSRTAEEDASEMLASDGEILAVPAKRKG